MVPEINISTESLHISIILLRVETETTFMKQADIHLKGTHSNYNMPTNYIIQDTRGLI
jgi:hypothetical protein